MTIRTHLSLALAGALLVLTAAPGHAALFTGTCAIRATVNLDEPITWTSLGAPNYTISVSGAVDLDPEAAGTQSCGTTLDNFEPLRRTTGNGSGDSTVFSCSTVFASGSWTQFWNEEDGGSTPPPLNGSHTLAGTWGAWTFEVANPSLNFFGVAEMTIAPETAAMTADGCVWGNTQRIVMVGTMVFQDP
jgi:hypothetical protein